MKILITGHRGLLGSACVRRLSLAHKIVTIDGDLRDRETVMEWFAWNRPDYVINCAAKVGGVKANRDQPVDFLKDNLAIQTNVIEASSNFGIEKLVSIGTSCLFPKDAPLPVSEDSLLTGPFDPSVQAYAIAKLSGYALCKAYHDQYGKNFMTACPSNLYGPGDNYGPSAHVIPAIMKRLLESIRNNEPLVVWGNGTAIREFLFVDDAAAAIQVILDKWNKPDAINVGTGVGISIRALVTILMEVAGGNVPVVWDNSQPTGIQNKTFDISKLKSLGWSPSTAFIDGIEATWKDFTTNPSHRSK